MAVKTATDTTERCPLLELPPELRNNIYEDVARSMSTIHVDGNRIEQHALTSTCRHVCEEFLRLSEAITLSYATTIHARIYNMDFSALERVYRNASLKQPKTILITLVLPNSTSPTHATSFGTWLELSKKSDSFSNIIKRSYRAERPRHLYRNRAVLQTSIESTGEGFLDGERMISAISEANGMYFNDTEVMKRWHQDGSRAGGCGGELGSEAWGTDGEGVGEEDGKGWGGRRYRRWHGPYRGCQDEEED
ncbi:hypothetical protein B0A50_07968 [Salinomyces thailandicus]|uniref:F-box domain-containing protein n=1 Tax=Salinomyces thailandicus TaxID=706561 RepID=A0A4U0TLA8_9PEZI|nr:hypothetical protein B0A50_07968 [Salinomyces thailandica]